MLKSQVCGAIGTVPGWTGCPLNGPGGNGDSNILDFAEAAAVWAHLTGARFLQGSYTGTATTEPTYIATPNEQAPRNPWRGFLLLARTNNYLDSVAAPAPRLHLITGANQAWGSRDEELKPDQTVSYRFDKPGIYAYACALHRGMSGAVVVGDLTAALSAGATTGGPTTAGGDTAGSGAGSPGIATSSGSAATESATPSNGSLAILGAAAAGAGGIGGAVVAWLAMRRRPMRDGAVAHAD